MSYTAKYVDGPREGETEEFHFVSPAKNVRDSLYHTDHMDGYYLFHHINDEGIRLYDWIARPWEAETLDFS